MSTGKFLCLLQDDDYPPPTDWLLRAVQLFNKVPSMGLLMGLQANVGPDKVCARRTAFCYVGEDPGEQGHALCHQYLAGAKRRDGGGLAEGCSNRSVVL